MTDTKCSEVNPCFNGGYSRSEINRNVGDDGVCLNPCSNGRYSRRGEQIMFKKLELSLNPCSNGRYSRSRTNYIPYPKGKVLILVLMEDTLGAVSVECTRQNR